MCIRDRVYRPEQNRRRRSAPDLDCDPCGSSAGCDLLRHTYGMSAPWSTAFFLGAPLSAPHIHCGLHAAPCPPGFNFFSERLLPCFLARPPASQSVLHCCTLQKSHSEQRPNLLKPTAAAQFLRQTPPTEFREISRYCSFCPVSYTHLTLPTKA